ncbi:hypothetical protein RhiirA5_436717 [Rhizophagus irregularis]|uniref:Uncharacterized protein n=1 Tax=Rhizophagus irregularis TaxID=588596 RepID=A0A2I1EJS5_9GLOM|nr:hypothetical protein RhiirA5_436717 [Rhizophagus irregularis]PKY22376.1 hypothetical protein RhiirB3_436311 [Rhizophagus irregularis]
MGDKFKKGFSRKKLNSREKRVLNHQIYAESTWFIDRESNSMCAKEFSGFVDENCQSKIKDGLETEIFQICRNSETVAVIPAKSEIPKSEIPAEMSKLNI